MDETEVLAADSDLERTFGIVDTCSTVCLCCRGVLFIGGRYHSLGFCLFCLARSQKQELPNIVCVCSFLLVS